MFKEKLLLENPHSKIRRTLAVVLYILFMFWIIYSHNRTSNAQPAEAKKTAATFQQVVFKFLAAR